MTSSQKKFPPRYEAPWTNLPAKRRFYENPDIGDKVALLAISEETNGEYSLGQVDLIPGGGNPPHHHKQFSETFTAVKGQLSVLVGNEWKTLQEGQSFTVTPGTQHCFRNNTKENIVFNVKVTPGHQGFEDSIRLFYGLAADGQTDKTGKPKKLAHQAIMIFLGDINFSGALALLRPILKWAYRKAQKSGLEKQLIDKYSW